MNWKKSIKRCVHLLKRAFFVLRSEGFFAVLKKTKNKVVKKFFKSSRKIKTNVQIEDVYAKVYSSSLSVAQNLKNSDYVPLPDIDLTDEALPIKLISFYLPQFHPIPENDQWWGRGFTEWANVSKAVPNFVGHYQPHLPGELGFYDLRVPEVQRRQVQLAKKFGIYGFCFYHYWFNGKKLLDLPLDMFVSDKEIDFPFCLCWANENWTRRWDGLAEDILISQNHSIDSDIAFIRDIEKYLKNKNYIRINDRPILIVYRPQILPDPVNTVARWKQYCSENGLGDLYMIAVQSSGFSDPRLLGFDAAVEFPPHGIPAIPLITEQLKITNPDFSGMIYDIKQASEFVLKKPHPDYVLFHTVSPSWDNTPRRQDQPLIFHNGTPENYQSWLLAAIKKTLKYCRKGENFVFINAWNEWAEGAHLEPDRKYGYSFLQATANAIRNITEKKDQASNTNDLRIRINRFNKKNETAVVLHLYYPELWEETASYLENLCDEYDLFVSIPENIKFLPEKILEIKPDAFIYRCKNQGRDIAPFLEIFRILKKKEYKYVCKIHTKKTVHREDGDKWRKEILDELLGSLTAIDTIKEHLNHNDIGIVGPKGQLVSTEFYIGGNQNLITELANKLKLPYNGEHFPFIAGSMFWFKPAAILPIFDLLLKSEDFPTEEGQKDSTLAHAIERFICLVPKCYGYKVIETGTFSEIPGSNFPYAVPFRKES